MVRRKKRFKFGFILIGLALIAATWVAADYYFNVYRHNQKDSAPAQTVAVPAAQNKVLPEVKKEAPAVAADGFKNETYRDDQRGFEFQYPVFSANDPQCPKLEKTEDGFSVGMFSFSIATSQGTLTEFINSELQGMAIDDKKTITIGGVSATRVDYQTTGMGWYGSDTFIERNGKFFEFGLLANESSAKCGGADDYEDRVYQSVISTLKFTN